jgi:hypothetical protein
MIELAHDLIAKPHILWADFARPLYLAGDP